MDANQMAYPMFGMFVLTIIVLITNLFLRVRAVLTKQIHPKYFKIFDSDVAKPPQQIIQAKNQLDNLFQMPVLFYGICLLSISLNRIYTLTVVLAWLYVGLRICHTLIHMTYNHVTHRLAAFLSSNIVLLILWINIVFGRV